nr:hypothetical protein [Pseudomonadota bacterium]
MPIEFRMISKVPITLAGIALVAFLAAMAGCQDGATPPAGEAPQTPAAAVDSAGQFAVTFAIRNAIANVAALQFDVNYSGGEFSGAAGDVECSSPFSGAIATFNNKGGGLLSGAVIDISGFAAPPDIATCVDTAMSNPGPADFPIPPVAPTHALPPPP